MGSWSIIVPEASTNYVKNPSAEGTANFGTAGTATVARSTAYSFKGPTSYLVAGTVADGGLTLTLSALPNDAHYASAFARGTLPSPWTWAADGSTFGTPAVIETHGSWSRYGLAFPAAQCNGATALTIKQSGTASTSYYVDAVQVE